jgi:hypothetical protein
VHPQRGLGQVEEVRRGRQSRLVDLRDLDRPAGHRALDERRLVDEVGQWTSVVERPGEREDAVQRHRAVVTLESGNPAERGRPQDRPDRLGSDRHRHVARSDGRRRAG